MTEMGKKKKSNGGVKKIQSTSVDSFVKLPKDEKGKVYSKAELLTRANFRSKALMNSARSRYGFVKTLTAVKKFGESDDQDIDGFMEHYELLKALVLGDDQDAVYTACNDQADEVDKLVMDAVEGLSDLGKA